MSAGEADASSADNVAEAVAALTVGGAGGELIGGVEIRGATLAVGADGSATALSALVAGSAVR